MRHDDEIRKEEEAKQFFSRVYLGRQFLTYFPHHSSISLSLKALNCLVIYFSSRFTHPLNIIIENRPCNNSILLTFGYPRFDRVDIMSLNGQSTTQFNKWLSLRRCGGCRILENCFSRLCLSLFIRIHSTRTRHYARTWSIFSHSTNEIFSHFIIIGEANEYIRVSPLWEFLGMKILMKN